MATTLQLKRIGRGLYPADGLAEEEILQLPPNKALKITATVPRRSVPQQRLYWAVLDLVAQNMDRPLSKETLHEWVKVRLGVVEFIHLRSGKIEEVAGSTSFDSMDQLEFQSYFDKATELICECLTKVGRDDLLNEARAMLGEPPSGDTMDQAEQDRLDNIRIEAREQARQDFAGGDFVDKAPHDCQDAEVWLQAYLEAADEAVASAEAVDGAGVSVTEALTEPVLEPEEPTHEEPDLTAPDDLTLFIQNAPAAESWAQLKIALGELKKRAVWKDAEESERRAVHAAAANAVNALKAAEKDTSDPGSDATLYQCYAEVWTDPDMITGTLERGLKQSPVWQKLNDTQREFLVRLAADAVARLAA